MIKKLAQKIILGLTRRDFTYDKTRKMSQYSLFVFMFLYLTIGLKWKISFGDKIGISVHINNIIWWTLILIQNSITFFFFALLRYQLNFRKIYQDNLIKCEKVIVGFTDDEFEKGKIYEVEKLASFYSGINNWQKRDFFIEGALLENGMSRIINGDKIFKFISLKENRKLKLQKLKRV
jgi:hypothetical protein